MRPYNRRRSVKTRATHAIILRRVNYGEADRILTLLTSEFGKVRAMAKGVRKSKSKLAGGIELFSVSEIHFIPGKGDIGTLVSTRLKFNYGNIVKDLERTEAAYAMLKTADKTLEDDADSEYFTVLHESLAALNEVSMPVQLAELSFTMRMLQLFGHVPDFSTDSSGQKLDPDATYSYDFESVSFKPVPDGMFNKNHLKTLKLLAHNPPQAMAAVQGIGQLCADIAPLVRSLQGYYQPS